jgi:hypothetical protein
VLAPGELQARSAGAVFCGYAALALLAAAISLARRDA